MIDFGLISPLMRELHAECVKIFYLGLPVCFALEVSLQWFRRSQGAVDFLGILKRTIIAVLLLVAFPEITDTIITVSEAIAARMDDVRNLDQLMAIAEEKVREYTLSPKSLAIAFNDFILSAITFISFMFLFACRYLSLGIFHFFWFFLVVASPLLILANIFSGGAQVTTGLFRSLIEVACWKIVWAILGVMLASISFGKMYLVEGAYASVIVMNIVIGVALLGTPILVRSLFGSGTSAFAPVAAAASLAFVTRIPSIGTNVARVAGLKAPPRHRPARSGRTFKKKGS